MDHQSGLYVIFLGERDDAFAGPLHLEEHEGGEFALPVFFSPVTLERYAEGIADGAESETGTVAQLRAGHFRMVWLMGERELFEVAAWAGVDCLRSWSPPRLRA